MVQTAVLGIEHSTAIKVGIMHIHIHECVDEQNRDRSRM